MSHDHLSDVFFRRALTGTPWSYVELNQIEYPLLVSSLCQNCNGCFFCNNIFFCKLESNFEIFVAKDLGPCCGWYHPYVPGQWRDSMKNGVGFLAQTTFRVFLKVAKLKTLSKRFTKCLSSRESSLATQ